MNNPKLGLINNWLMHIRDVYLKYKKYIERIKDEEKRCDKLCELNILTQIYNLGNSTILQEAWGRGQKVNIHAWIYSLEDGLITQLDYATKLKEVQDETHQIAVKNLLSEFENE